VLIFVLIAHCPKYSPNVPGKRKAVILKKVLFKGKGS
jgi:hypothetical protein